MNTEKGFIRLIIILVILGVVLTIMGYNPVTLWNMFVIPVLSFIWGIIVWFVDFLVSLIREGGEAFDKILNVFGLNR